VSREVVSGSAVDRAEGIVKEVYSDDMRVRHSVFGGFEIRWEVLLQVGRVGEILYLCQDLVGSQDARRAPLACCGYKVVVQCFTQSKTRLLSQV
jgi:hypothetical protein